MKIKFLILGMMIVTAIPRILPFFAFDPNKLPRVIKKFLDFVPYTVLGALILPGGFNGIVDHPLISAISLGSAIIISWFKGGIIGPIIGAVSTAIILKLIGLY